MEIEALGLYVDSGTGLAVVIRRQCVSFLRQMDSLEHFTLSEYEEDRAALISLTQPFSDGNVIPPRDDCLK